MPSLTLVTNVKVENEKEFILEFSKFSAETLKKPLAYITTSISYNETLNFAGTFDPCFTLQITSLDNISAEKNEEYSKALSEFFKTKLGLDSGRGYIQFTDPGRANLGFQGTTFATIFKS